MDASQYLRRRLEACPKILSRRQDCRSAGERTHMLGLLATSTYISPANRVEGRIPLACEVAKPSEKGDTQPVKGLPGVDCAGGLCSSYFNDPYTTPNITLPGCEYTMMSTITSQTCGTPCYKGTPAQYRDAVKRETDRQQYSCCT